MNRVITSKAAKGVSLHIGAPKTGTTSVQQFLDSNAEGLLKQGIAGHTWRQPTGIRLPILARPADKWDPQCASWWRQLTGLTRRPTLKEWQEFRRLQTARLVNWGQNSDAGRLVFSHEGLWALDASSIERLRYLLEDITSDTRIFAWIREPIGHSISAWSARVQFGLDLERMELIKPGQSWRWNEQLVQSESRSKVIPPWDFHARLARWDTAFPSRVKVNLYSPPQSGGKSIIDQFCRLLEIEKDAGLAYPPRTNTSLSFSMMRVFNDLNRRYPRLTQDGSINPLGGNLANVRRVCDADTRSYEPSATEVSERRGHFADGNLASSSLVPRRTKPVASPHFTTLSRHGSSLRTRLDRHGADPRGNSRQNVGPVRKAPGKNGASSTYGLPVKGDEVVKKQDSTPAKAGISDR